MEPLNKGHFWDIEGVLYTEVSLIRRLYTNVLAEPSVLYREVSNLFGGFAVPGVNGRDTGGRRDREQERPALYCGGHHWVELASEHCLQLSHGSLRLLDESRGQGTRGTTEPNSGKHFGVGNFMQKKFHFLLKLEMVFL